MKDDRIASWTVGMGDQSPEYYYLPRLVDLKGPCPEYRSFDWERHVQATAQDVTYSVDGSMNIEEVKNELIFGSPLLSHLEIIKSAIIESYDKLRGGLESKKRLVSTTMLRPKYRKID